MIYTVLVFKPKKNKIGLFHEDEYTTYFLTAFCSAMTVDVVVVEILDTADISLSVDMTLVLFFIKDGRCFLEVTKRKQKINILILIIQLMI